VGEPGTAGRRTAPDLFANRATLALIATNIALYVLEILLARGVGAASMPPGVLRFMGANESLAVVQGHRIELLVTSCFLHWSLMHIAFNMYALRQVGPFVERSVGAARFTPMYLGSGIAGSAASAAWGWFNGDDRLSAGASGAICGVIGTALVLGVRVQGWRGPIVRSMGFWLLLTIVLGAFIHADNAAHIGGAVTGALFGALWKRGMVYTPLRQRVTLAACALLVVASFAVVFVRDLDLVTHRSDALTSPSQSQPRSQPRSR
jgi:rhomboid protease GluP